MSRTWALTIAAASIAAFVIADLHYNDVVDNSRASGVEMVAFLVGYCGGIFGICFAATVLLGSLLYRRDR